MIPTGSGVPWWVPTEKYLSGPEIRALDPVRYGNGGRCLICGEPPGPPAFRLEGAHAWRGGMGGRKQGGPTFELCHSCHQGSEGIDRCGDKTLAIRRDTLQGVLLTFDGETVTEKALRW